MSRLFAGLVLASAVVGCSKSNPSTSTEAPKPGSDPNKPDPKMTPNPTAPTEEDAVKFVERLGGTVKRDEKQPGQPVVEVDLSGKDITDAGLKELAPLKGLTTLNIRSPKLTDAGMKELASFTALTELNIDGKITDAGLKELAVLKNLTALKTGFDVKFTPTGRKEFEMQHPKCVIYTSFKAIGEPVK